MLSVVDVGLCCARMGFAWHVFRLAGFVAVLLSGNEVVSGEDAMDWRLQLLAEEGVPDETSGLLKMQAGFVVSAERLENAVGRLGADQFATREQAECEIRRMGRDVLPFLRRLQPLENPEVRARLAGVETDLATNGRWGKGDLLRQAVTSLLIERTGGKRSPRENPFVELFRTELPSVTEGYRDFRHVADEGMNAIVSKGILRMTGKPGGEGGQSLLLDAKAATGKAVFPDVFRIEVSLGGSAGGEGAYHVGVSVGNVRALYHPGYQSGEFRFERVDNHEHVTENTAMGFEPTTGVLQRMILDVERHAGGAVEMRVEITDGGKTFREQQLLEKDVIGKLDHIGLDRSGREGGDGLFDDLVVDMGAR